MLVNDSSCASYRYVSEIDRIRSLDIADLVVVKDLLYSSFRKAVNSLSDFVVVNENEFFTCSIFKEFRSVKTETVENELRFRVNIACSARNMLFACYFTFICSVADSRTDRVCIRIFMSYNIYH